MPTVTIDPVTRIEGHSKITLQTDARGDVVDAHFHVTQLRGFEKILRRTPFDGDARANGADLRHLPGFSHLITSAEGLRHDHGRHDS